MYKQILVPVDGSHTSGLALQEAIKLGKDQQARLRIVHVVDALMYPLDLEFVDVGAIQQGLRQSGNAILEDAQAVARKAGVEAETKLLDIETPGRRIAGTIVTEAETWPADIIVIGTHGRRGLDHLLMGSVAEDVARRSQKPVLLVRGE
jgi:nucleotide-binding universal stress UspA family protein